MKYVGSALTRLECPECREDFNADKIQTFCQDCRSPLLARYDLDAAARTLTPENISHRARGVWRWAEILPVKQPAYRLTLGEGGTPLLKTSHLGQQFGASRLYIKDESNNPTGSFKARGLVMAVSRALELGVRDFVIPTAGNAGGALAAYAARGRARAHIYMPNDAPRANQVEVKISGANLHLVDGLISDAARQAGEDARMHGWLDVSTFKEPYRCEGKKTMGLELAEAFDWELPDVVIYPTGGGTGLVGMWKAFSELETLGWIGPQRPRMVAVQSSGCAPVVRAFEQGVERTEFWDGAQTIASGLRVPSAFADRLILRILHESNGTAVAVSDDEIIFAQQEMARSEGIFPAPEGAATLAALRKLFAQGWVNSDERIVLFNTGNGLKYL